MTKIIKILVRVKRKVSLKDIAKELGISISTVSRALKDHPNISRELKDKVNELATKWGYTPNPFALGLLQKKTFTLGVVVPDIVTHFYASIITGIEKEASKHGYQIVISSSNESSEKEKTSIQNFLKLQVEGLIVCLSEETQDYTLFFELQKEKFPIVFFDRIVEKFQFPSVVVNNQQATSEIIDHFVTHGYKKIAFINGPEHLSICQQRKEGYYKGLKQNNLAIKDEYLVNTKLNYESAKETAKKILGLTDPPDAIFGINDLVTFAIMEAVKKQKIKIPEEMGLIGFTDEFHAKLVDPSLTSVVHPTIKMGTQAAKMIFTQINSPDSFIPHTVELETRLVERESTGKSGDR